ncbi:MAG: DUF4280 domain-containing protein [Lachnospiraceae bacterium]|nr:DUF4280 domain-containing protein [Lachnospiraceae bacterium]
MAEGKITAEAKVEEEGLEQQASYVLHGGKAYCQWGSRESRLQVPKCHGTYIHDMPMMVHTDVVVKENIQPFGYCYCMENPDRAAKVQEILDAVEEETHDLLDAAMDGVNAIGDFLFGGDDEEEVSEEEMTLLEQNVTIMCKPGSFKVQWDDASEDLYINGEKALTNHCTIVCTKCGGLVSISDDGQENAAFEQQSKQDMSEWKEGDPIPEASQANLQQLKEMGKEDSELYQKMEEQIEEREDLNKRLQYYRNKDQGTYNELLQQKQASESNYKSGKWTV